MSDLLKRALMVCLVMAGCTQQAAAQSRSRADVAPLPVAAPLPVRTGQFEHAGLTLHYSMIGKGSVVVMLSGGPGFDSYMMPVGRMIAADHRVIVLDQRGTGQSRPAVIDATTVNEDLVVEDIEALRLKLGVSRLSLVGHSFGTLTAMRYALAHPDRVDRLILLSTVPPRAAEMSLDAAIAQRLAPADLNRLAALDAASAKPGAGRDAAQMEIATLILPAYLYDKTKVGAVMASMSGGLHADTSEQIWRSVGKFDMTAGMAAIRAPVLIVQGRQDPLDVSGAQKTAQAIAGAKLVILGKCGHFAWIEAPTALATTMTAFLAQRFTPARRPEAAN